MISQGLAEIEKSLLFDPDNPDTLYTRGVCLTNLDRAKEARRDFTEALSQRKLPNYSAALVGANLVLREYAAAEAALLEHIKRFAEAVSVPLSHCEVGDRLYTFQGVQVSLNHDDECYLVASDDLRIFGSGPDISEALEEWLHVFRLNYTDFVEAGEPLSPSGDVYAAQLRDAVEISHGLTNGFTCPRPRRQEKR